MRRKRLWKGILTFLFFPRQWLRWCKRGMAWPWILILTGLGAGIIAAIQKWIEKANTPPGL